jgi:NAD+ kinase
MRYCIRYKKDKTAVETVKKLILKLEEHHFVLDEKVPEIVFSVGGDGTFLKAVHDFFEFNPLFVAINRGNLGFLCEFTDHDIDDLVDEIIQNSLPIRTISLLEGKFMNQKIYALNEIRVESCNGTSIQYDVNINNSFLETCRSDGACVSTSIGSSGLARSLGGSLVDNEIEMLQFIEKAPISNRRYNSLRSPFVLNVDKTITLSNFSYDYFNIFFDCKFLKINAFKGDIQIRISPDKKIRVLQNHDIDYIKKTRETLIK